MCHLVLSDPDGFTIQAGGPAGAFVAPAAREHGVPGAAALVGAASGGRQKKGRLLAGTPEHKADRWARYQQQRAGAPDAWTYARWEKQYDTNMQNVAVGLGAEVQYKEKFGGVSKVMKTAFTLRQIDMYREAELYCGQLKTGKISLGKQEKLDLQKDGWLIATLGMEVEYVLEKGASKPMLEALAKIGAKVTIGSQL